MGRKMNALTFFLSLSFCFQVQERQNRVCTTVAIAIVAETCSPFTVLPALMNEYRVPELNVQNGVLKSLSFLFEYIGEMGKDYIYAVTPLLEDALMDRYSDILLLKWEHFSEQQQNLEKSGKFINMEKSQNIYLTKIVYMF